MNKLLSNYYYNKPIVYIDLGNNINLYDSKTKINEFKID